MKIPSETALDFGWELVTGTPKLCSATWTMSTFFSFASRLVGTWLGLGTASLPYLLTRGPLRRSNPGHMTPRVMLRGTKQKAPFGAFRLCSQYLQIIYPFFSIESTWSKWPSKCI